MIKTGANMICSKTRKIDVDFFMFCLLCTYSETPMIKRVKAKGPLWTGALPESPDLLFSPDASILRKLLSHKTP